ncbi:NAD(P)-binding protein [Macrolepiota fuliginosa MF-IS2]|uniref:3-oxoacyl-[acyl-carrier-protein] reductase n=1 Tax=Macrolepiota fuliginosa MF-IS2 TaxID=1400762 RepID=A0A9P6C140_9AGAR|nr:NAD(P)-binding protein [Macrolepiota fuliginosa MF-IS2]
MSSQFQDTGSLKGKLALVTGCTGGIGHATALALARRGCSIAVHYNTAEEKARQLLLELKQFPDVAAAAFQADLSGYDGVRKLHAEVVKTMGNPDILFNNAGALNGVIGPNGNIQDISVEAFEATWRTNTGTAFLLTQLCLPSMEEKKWGRIVFNSSVAAGIGGVIGPHYASSKSAMHGLLHWIANRYAREGITCNAVAPALITETTMMASATDQLRKGIPVGRFGYPQEIASVVEMLVTNSYMTNKIVVADGGMTASAF